MDKDLEKRESEQETKKEKAKEIRYMSEPDAQGVRYFAMGGQGTAMSNAIEQKYSKKYKMWRSIAIVMAVLLVISLAAVGFGNANNENTTGGIPDGIGEYIATIYVEGTIQPENKDYFGTAAGYQHDWTIDRIDDLIYDSSNKGLIIYVNSPGGTVYESDELYLKIREYQQETERPVYAYMGSMAASGGYYISAPADQIFANRNTWTGSIGVTVGTIFDFTGLMDKYGIKSKTITSGEHKAMGSAYAELSAEEEAIWQSLVDEAYEQFTGIVAEGRDMDIDTVKKVADGRIYTAAQAQKAGLIDEIGDFAACYNHMRDTYGLEDCEIRDVEYVDDSTWGQLFSRFGNTAKSKDEVATLVELTERESLSPVSYMCEFAVEQ